jgi:Ca-activated chloride channel family protein
MCKCVVYLVDKTLKIKIIGSIFAVYGLLSINFHISQISTLVLKFQHIEFIWLFGGIILLVLLFLLLITWKRKVKKRMGDPKLVQALIANYSPSLFIVKFVLVILALAAGIIAAMNLRRPAADETSSRKGIDVVIALDVSRSMLAADLPPNRLERAKQLIGKLMDAMPDDRIGLVVFAGRAYLQMPLTTDYGAAQLYVSSASPDVVPFQGTVVSEALRQSANAFNTTERRFKTVVLISDGEDHDPESVNTAKELATEGMMINTVGIGSPEGSYIPDPETGGNKKDASGNDIISRLNEDGLKQIAESTNGIYVRLQDSDEAVKQLQQQFSGIESKAYGDVSLMNFQTFYWWFAGAMFLLLVVDYFIPETKKLAV